MKHDPAEAGLPPVLTRADFDSDEEYREYLDIENAELREDDKTPEMRAMWRRIGEATRRDALLLALPEADRRKLDARAAAEGASPHDLAARILHDWLETR